MVRIRMTRITWLRPLSVVTYDALEYYAGQTVQSAVHSVQMQMQMQRRMQEILVTSNNGDSDTTSATTSA